MQGILSRQLPSVFVGTASVLFGVALSVMLILWRLDGG